MDFGIAFPSFIRSWQDVALAEQYRFTHAWFYDSQMLYSDVFATMALAAHHTKSIKLGTLVCVLGSRIPPVTANAIATINELRMRPTTSSRARASFCASRSSSCPGT
jgi:5,10-methylenetetrahydromethanopterin reductase